MSVYKHIRHIYFDLDRTLWDFAKNSREAIGDVYREYKLDECGYPNEDTFFKVYDVYNDYCWDRYRQNRMSKSYLRHQRFYMTLNHFGKPDRVLARQLGKAYVDISPYKTALVQGTVDILEYLSPKYKLHIITNGFQEVQSIKLQQSKIDHYFDQIVTSERVGKRKPDPLIFRFALEVAGATAEESIMIGDDYDVDVKGAEGVGMSAIHFDEVHINGELENGIHLLENIRNFL